MKNMLKPARNRLNHSHLEIAVIRFAGIAGERDTWLAVAQRRGELPKSVSTSGSRGEFQHQRDSRIILVAVHHLQWQLSWMPQHQRVLPMNILLTILDKISTQDSLRALFLKNTSTITVELGDILESTLYTQNLENVRRKRLFGSLINWFRTLNHWLLFAIWLKDPRFTAAKLRRYYFLKKTRMSLLTFCLFPRSEWRFHLENPFQKMRILVLMMMRRTNCLSFGEILLANMNMLIKETKNQIWLIFSDIYWRTQISWEGSWVKISPILLL